MCKKIYLFMMFLTSFTSVYAVDTVVQPSSGSGLAIEWIALIVLALTGFIFIFRSAKQIKKIKELQDELDTYHVSVFDELDSLGGKNV